MIGEFLRRITAALDMTGVPYMLTGSVASSMYGVPRATNDIDIVVAPTREQLLSLVQLFQRIGLMADTDSALAALRTKGQFNVIDFPKGWKLDVIVRKDREFSSIEFDRRETHEVEGMRLTIATPEDVLIAKLEWAKMGESERQLGDAAGILKMQSATLDVSYIHRWVTALGLEEQWNAARAAAE
jgi:hypothetical protein